MTPSDEVKLLWALTKISHHPTFAPSTSVVDTVIQDLRTKLATFSPQDLVLTTWALAHLSPSSSPSHPKLLAHLCKQLPSWLPSFTAPQLANLLQSLATLAPQSGDGLWDACKEEVDRRLKTLLDQGEAAAAAAAGGGGGGRGGSREGNREEDVVFHLAKCQALLGGWKKRVAGAAAAATKGK